MAGLRLDEIVEHMSRGEYIFYIFTWKNNKIKTITIEPYDGREIYYTGNRSYYRSLWVSINDTSAITLGNFYDKKSKQGHIFGDSILAEEFRRRRVGED